jgi:hypothetical protein
MMKMMMMIRLMTMEEEHVEKEYEGYKKDK